MPTLSSVQGVRPGTLREGGEPVGKGRVLDTSLEEADLTAFVIRGGDLSYANLFEKRDLKGQDLGGCASWRRSSPVATSRGRTSGGEDLARANLSGARLKGADLRGRTWRALTSRPWTFAARSSTSRGPCCRPAASATRWTVSPYAARNHRRGAPYISVRGEPKEAQ